MNNNDPIEYKEIAYELTDKQKDIVRLEWEKANAETGIDLGDICSKVWGVKTDPRSWQGRLVKNYLIGQNIKIFKPNIDIKKDGKKIELSIEQKDFILKNSKTMSVMKIAQEIFQNPNLKAFHPESRVVIKYYNEINPKIVDKIKENLEENSDEQIETKRYYGPRSLVQVVARVNKYLYNQFDATKLTAAQKKNFQTLISYLASNRFRLQCNSYDDLDDLTLFEETFIRCTYDKPDLTEEEVDQYIVYSTEVVISHFIQKRINLLESQQDIQLEEEGGRINMALVEAVKSLRDEYNKCIKRQGDLLNDLKGKRSARLNDSIKDSASILNLVQLWKEEESRKEMIEIAKKEQESLSEEFDRLNSMEDVKAKILGITKEEVLLG